MRGPIGLQLDSLNYSGTLASQVARIFDDAVEVGRLLRDRLEFSNVAAFPGRPFPYNLRPAAAIDGAVDAYQLLQAHHANHNQPEPCQSCAPPQFCQEQP